MESNEQTQTVSQPIVPRTNPEIKDGVLVIKTLDEACRHAAMIHKSGLAPNHFDSPEKVLVAMQMAQELGLPPMTALKSMYVVNGTPSLYGDLPLAVVQKSGLLEKINECWFDVNDKLIHPDNKNSDAEVHRAECTVKRFGMDPVTRSFSLKEARTAGLDKNVYLKYRKRMLQMRARSWALKDAFSDILNGISIKEYDDYDQAKDVTNQVQKISLNDKLLLQKEQMASNPPVALEPEPPKVENTVVEAAKEMVELAAEMTEPRTVEMPPAEPSAPKPNTFLQKMAGETRINCVPRFKGMKINEVDRDELLTVLGQADIRPDLFDEEFKTFYDNACTFLGRLKANK